MDNGAETMISNLTKTPDSQCQGKPVGYLQLPDHQSQLYPFNVISIATNDGKRKRHE